MSDKTENGTVYINDFADQSNLRDNTTASKKLAVFSEKDIYIPHHFDGGKAPNRKNPELGISTKNKLMEIKHL